MIFRIVLLGIFLIAVVYCNDSGSAETNKIEETPIFDTIVFSDVADILHEFENGINPIETIFNSASASEERLEDLLAEYQHYLEKAHQQRMNYLEKTKTKNKVPLVRHDRFAKTKAAGGMKYDDNYYPDSYMNPNKFSQTVFNNPYDLFTSFNPKLVYSGKNDVTQSRGDYSNFDKKIIQLSPLFTQAQFAKPNCFCKSAQLPCDCKCKKCFLPLDTLSQTNSKSNADYVSEDSANDNTLNIRIKVDIQLPNTKELSTKMLKNRSHEEFNTKETSVSVPFPYFSFPVSMDMLGYKKTLKPNSHDFMHKLAMHKKKKSRTNNGSKKHKKKYLTIHNLNAQPQQISTLQPVFNLDENYNVSGNNGMQMDKIDQSSLNRTNITSNVQPDTLIPNSFTPVTNSKVGNITGFNIDTQTEENVYVMVNISNTVDNVTEDGRKIENSLETENTKIETNLSTGKLLRKRRDTLTPLPKTTSTPLTVIGLSKPDLNLVNKVMETFNATTVVMKKNEKALDDKNPQEVISGFKHLHVPNNETRIIKQNNDTKKSNKILLADAELDYWPDSSSYVVSKNITDSSQENITSLILERENKKAKVNMSKEAIKHNRTTALEKAIFGEVNWDDVDTVAPVFLSFVGKYLNGILTFCSQNKCHSMKCEEKKCLHRVCTPIDRWNQRGHCTGSNKTDSLATLESIMDLPSNVAFEIVDILQDKMLGKLFGKVTLCINFKCISFIAVKKKFLKSKCHVKELNMGYCPNIKNFKTL